MLDALSVPQGEGWGRPPEVSKPHYFVNGDALCGKWSYRGYVGVVLDDPRINDRTYADNLGGCRECRKQLRGRVAITARAAREEASG